MKKYEELVLDRRIEIEKQFVSNICKNKKKIKSIPRTPSGKIACFTPYTYEDNVCELPYRVKSEYGYLSRKLHYSTSERNDVEKEILQITGITKRKFPHLLWNLIDTYEKYITFANSRGYDLIKKHKYQQVLKLIKKWRALSNDFHYSLTKQEKRKLKKLV